MYTVEQAPRELNFGRQGESNILSYQFDFSQWAEDWPGGLASMTVILPNQTQPQPIPDTQAVVDGTIITLHVLDNLTEKDGRGTLIIRYVAGTNKKRSRLIEFVVEKGHETQVGSGLAVVEDWVDEAVETLNDVKSLEFTINEDGELLAGETVLGRVSDNPRGAYNPGADPLYSKRDIVFDNGGSYRYINDTLSNEPTSSASHWQQIASQGMTGPSAYDAAVAGGYTGNEAEFNAANAGIEAAVDGANGAAETANEAAENAETAAYRSMLWRKTASGNPVSVYPVPESPLYPKVSGTFTQSGVGDSSPSNIRPITPWLASGGAVNIVQTGGATITLTAPQEIAAGWMDNEGRGQVTWGKRVFDGTESFTVTSPGAQQYFSLSKPAGTYPSDVDGACSHYKVTRTLDVAGVDKAFTAVTHSFRIKDTTYATVGDLKAYLAAQYAAGTPVTIYYQLATPVSITPASAPLPALPQLDRITPRVNVLTASAGNVELTYAKSPIRDSDDIAAAIAAL